MRRLARQLADWMVGGLSRWRYQLEKGQPHLTVFLGLLTVMAGLMLGGGFILWVAGEATSPWAGMWWVFLYLTDPGYLGGATGPVQTTLGTVLTVVGIVVFTSGVIAIITNLLSAYLARLAQGGHDVAFSGHIVIIGWSDRVPALVFELLEADHDNEVAILASVPKRDADSELDRRVFRTFRSATTAWQRLAFWRDARRNVVYRQGSPLVEADLRRVGAGKATRFILLAPEGRRGVDIDVQMMRTFLVIRDHRRTADEEAGLLDPLSLSCVVEITENRLREHVFLASGLDPRGDSWVAFELQRQGPERAAVPDPHTTSTAPDHDLTLVNSDELISRALVQCAVQPRLSAVHDELLSFTGRDFYVLDSHELNSHFSARGGRQARARWQLLIQEAEARSRPDAEVPGQLARYLQNGLVIGALDFDERGADMLLLRPGDWRYRLPSGDQARDRAEGRLALVILGEGSRRGRLGGHEPLTVRPAPLPPPVRGAYAPTDVGRARAYRVLVLGSNRRLGVLIEQFAQYTEQYHHLDLALTIVDPALPQDISTLLPHDDGEPFCESSIDVVRADFSEWSVLRGLLETGPQQGPAFDSIVLLSEDWDAEGTNVDARVVLGLVMLRAFRNDRRTAVRLGGTSVVAELLDSDNRRLFLREDWVTDVIVTNQYVSRFAAQVAHDHRVETLYREILDFGGREIYVRPVSAYQLEGPAPRFLDLVAAGAHSGEIVLGIMRDTTDGRSLPSLAPDPSSALADTTEVLVLADE